MLVVVRTGSFSTAAEELGLTHGAVSRRIQAVENWLGTALFERHARGARVTPAGQRFAAEVERAFAGIGRAAEQWRPGKRLDTVRISAVPSFGRLWLIPRLGALQGEPPDLLAEPLLEHRLADLGAGEADVALRYGRGGWPGLKAQLLFRERLVPVAAPALAAHLGPRPTAQAIAAQPLLHDSDTHQWRAWLATAGQRYRPRPLDRRIEDYDMVLSMAEAGLGIALARLPLAAPALAQGRLVRLSRRSLSNPASHFVVVRNGESRPEVLRLVTRLLATARG